MRVIDAFDRSASAHADRACLIDDTQTLTYGEVRARTLAMASALADLDGKHLTRFAVLGPNCADTLVAILSVFRAGGVWVMAGYMNDPAATAASRRGAWHTTGDIGHRDQDGYVYITDRKRDMIIRSGYNVYPSEMLSALVASLYVLVNSLWQFYLVYALVRPQARISKFSVRRPMIPAR
jgi:acyl-CoA synthetase (AMP-forming)/AMP-acid ligase II